MKTVMVTGANRGIGLELVRQYAADGERVFACCRKPQAADSLRDVAEASADRMTVYRLDVTSPEDTVALKQTLGAAPIDILINNAGISGGPGPDVDYDAWEQAFRVNSIAPYRISTTFHANLASGTLKKLATISSQLGSITNNSGGRTAYRASKAAVNQVMKGLAHEYQRDGIAVIMLHPGWVRTDMGGPQAPVSPEESASGIKHVIENLRVENTGKFIDFQGRELPW